VFVITDELSINFTDSTNHMKEVKLVNTEIAWPSDKEIKFRNPPGNLSDGEFYIQSCSQVCISKMYLTHGRIILTNVMHHNVVPLLICSCTCLVIHRRQHLPPSLNH